MSVGFGSVVASDVDAWPPITPGTSAPAVAAGLRDWLDVLDDEGKLFRSITRHGAINGSLTGKSVARIVKRSAGAAGLDPAAVAGHSLRSGFATSAASAGASERAIAKQTGHKSLQVLRGYIRDGNLFRENAATMVGL